MRRKLETDVAELSEEKDKFEKEKQQVCGSVFSNNIIGPFLVNDLRTPPQKETFRFYDP